ncbi:hypothetical protein ACQKO6_09635 [Pseudomonas monteilii]|uniref:hypothetical protein n=1 Tax=Pseudomonas alabamensis TaxID=3064349 RepID=UPI0021D7DA41|nr:MULTISPECIES: hypothetical protein [Pseudomonas]MDO7910651.1 hypothetical protein [Pseudomonas sp. 22-AL-CL-001]
MSTVSTTDAVKHLPVTSVDEPMFFVVSPRKLVIMSILTANFYMLYWFARNWVMYKRKHGGHAWPVIRTVLLPFFLYGLFKRVDQQIKLSGRTYAWSPLLMTCAFWIYCVVQYVMFYVEAIDPMPVRALFTSLVSIAFCVRWIVLAQHAINFCVGDPEGKTNETLSWGNWVWIAVGLMFWAAHLVALSQLGAPMTLGSAGF